MSTTSDPILELGKMFNEKNQECMELLNNTQSNFDPGQFCAGTFDGWVCWPDTKIGTYAQANCPDFIVGFDPSRLAHKVCDENGNWFKHPENNRTWSNYTTCVNIDDFEWKQQINLVYETGYCISLIAILLSLAILSYFRSLKCARITLHMNLFASFAANNSLWLLWYRAVLGDTEVIKESGTGCIILHIVLHYFLLTNYTWMLCEGFYLHTVLVYAFVSEQRLVRWLIVWGWVTPGIILIFYSLFRGFHGDKNDNKHCWSEAGPYTNILVALVCVTIVMNLTFLCNIVRVVMVKLKAPAGASHSRPSRTILQAFRATLLLVPLLGLQYMLTPFQPSPGHPWEKAYDVLSALTASFQGLWVATLFCFFNGEVMAQVKRKWGTVFVRPRSNSYTATQVSFVRCAPQSPGEEKV